MTSLARDDLLYLLLVGWNLDIKRGGQCNVCTNALYTVISRPAVC